MRSLPFLLSSLVAPLAAQTVVDYPDSIIGGLAGQYPIYTGTGLNVIRGQSFCPGTFAGLPATPMLCTRVGIQLGETAGPVGYAQFVMRVGTTTLTTMTGTFATNLPDQRIQLDLSGTAISGGPNVNVWVEWQLANPFYYAPGDGVVIDFTTQAAVAGSYLRTAIGTGVPRVISTNYSVGAGGSALAGGGIKFRMVFEPLALVQYGQGCPGTGQLVPTIGELGQATIGNPAYLLTLNDALGGSLCALLLGFPANVDIGGGCRIYNTGAAFVLLQATGSGPGMGTAAFPLGIPNNTAFLGTVLDAQWGVFDPASMALLPVATTAGAKVVVF